MKPDNQSRVASYKKSIINEAERWLLWGRPIPVFFLASSGQQMPSNPLVKNRNLASPDSGDQLIPIDYRLVQQGIKDRFPELAKAIEDAPSRRYAILAVIESDSTEIVRIDLGHNSQIIDAVDREKLKTLLEALTEYRDFVRKPNSKAQGLSSFREVFKALLADLLQRPPSADEIEQLLSTLARE